MLHVLRSSMGTLPPHWALLALLAATLLVACLWILHETGAETWRRWSLRRAHRRAARELPPRDPNVCRAPWARSPRRFGRLSRGLTSPPAPPRSGEGSLDSGPADRFASGAVAT